jgi:uncharacterized OB-fold protein
VTVVTSLHQFFERARAGELTAIRCEPCGTLAIPPKEFCASCGARSWQPVALAGTGTITSYTVIRVPSRTHAAIAPYAVALVRLTEGVSLLGRVVGLPLEAVRVGLAVRFRPLVEEGRTAIGFGPAP